MARQLRACREPGARGPRLADVAVILLLALLTGAVAAALAYLAYHSATSAVLTGGGAAMRAQLAGPDAAARASAPDTDSPQAASSNVLANIVLATKSIYFAKWLLKAKEDYAKLRAGRAAPE